MANLTSILFILTTGVAFAALAIAPAPTGQQMTDAMHAAFGDNHSRAVHAKGTLVEGTFTPDPAARSVSKAKLFTLPTSMVLARSWVGKGTYRAHGTHATQGLDRKRFSAAARSARADESSASFGTP